MHISSRHLKTFQAAMVHGSTIAAAVALNITQPSISRAIKELEELVGFTLFVRDRNGLHPTIEAEQLYEEASKAYNALIEVTNVAEQIKNNERGLIRLAAPPIYIDGIVSANISDFIKSHPNIRFKLISESKSKVAQMVESGQVDIGIISLPESSQALSIDHKFKRFAQFICAKGTDYESKSIIKVSDFKTDNFIKLTSDTPLRIKLDNYLLSQEQLDSTIEVEHQRAAVNIVSNGGGVSIVDPDVILDSDLEQLTCRPLSPALEWETAIISSKRRRLSDVAIEFKDWLAVVFDDGF